MTGRDERTERYFDENTPTYSLGRYEKVIEFLRNETSQGASLLDIGCGSGNVLKLVSESTSIPELAGVDVSTAYLGQCAAAVPGCRVYCSSILNSDLQPTIGRKYRYVLVGAVLHHLVGTTRRESRGCAWEGMKGAWSLVESGGALILMEPTFRPRWAMSTVFHVKRLASKAKTGRLPLFGYWNNIGEPVVSYFSHAELVHAASALPRATIVVDAKRTKRLPASWRAAGITERADSVLIVRKEA